MLALLAGAMAWTTYRNYLTIETIQHREMRVQDLRGQILHLDVVLTDSCSLAAATGEPRWEERYRKLLPELDAAIHEANELVPDAKRELTEVDEANLALVKLEDQVFALVRQNDLKKAWELLNSEAYRQNKSVYATGLESFSNLLKTHSESAIRAARREAMWFMVAAITLGCVVAIMLLIGFFSMFRMLSSKAVAIARSTASSLSIHR